jgi:invasion protein IalB
LIFSPIAVLKTGISAGSPGPVTLPPYLATRQPAEARQGQSYRVSAPQAPKPLVNATGTKKDIFSMKQRILPALLAAAGLTLAAFEAQAQIPPPAQPKAAPKAAPAPAAPKAAPKAPSAPAAQQQAPAPQQQADQQAPQLIYSPWTKFCMKGQEANAKQICFTGKDGRIESGLPVVAAIVIEPEGEPRKLLRVTLPLGMSLQQGTRVVVDQNEAQSKQSAYSFCLQNGCMSDYEASPEMLANMKKGQTLYVQAIQVNGAAVTLSLPLSDFAKAYDGPPTDPKIIEEQQKKFQEDLQKRAQDMRDKLQNQGGAAPQPK